MQKHHEPIFLIAEGGNFDQLIAEDDELNQSLKSLGDAFHRSRRVDRATSPVQSMLAEISSSRPSREKSRARRASRRSSEDDDDDDDEEDAAGEEATAKKGV